MRPFCEIEIDASNETHGACCICTCEYDVEEDNEADSICVLPCKHIFHKGEKNRVKE